MSDIDELLFSFRSKINIIKNIIKIDSNGITKDGCHVCGARNILELRIHHTNYWSNVRYFNYSNSEKYHQALEKDMVGHESELYTLCDRHHTLIEKMVRLDPSTALTFIRAFRFYYENSNLGDEYYFHFLCEKLEKTYPKINHSCAHTSDFENWRNIEEVYIKTISYKFDMMYCPVCNDFMYDPCVHYEYIWELEVRD